MSRGQSQPGIQVGRRTVDMYSEKSQSEDVVIIDVENDYSHTHTIIGVSESSNQRLEDFNVTRKDNTLQPMGITIISIDDEEEDLSSGNDHEGGAGESDGDECDSIWRNLSTWQRTYHGESLLRNNFGSNPDCESNSSENDDYDCKSSSSETDDSDCEILEGSPEEIREQWEKAALRKKMDVHVGNGQTGSADQVCADGSNSDTQNDLEEEYRAEHHGKATTSSSKPDNEKVDVSTSKTAGDGLLKDPFLDPDKSNPIADSVQTEDGGNSSWCKTQSSNKSQFPHKEGGVRSRRKTPPKGLYCCGTELKSEPGVNCNGASFRDIPGRSFGFTRDDQVQFNYGRHSSKVKEENVPTESCTLHTLPGMETCFNPRKASFLHKKDADLNSHELDEIVIIQDSVLPLDEDEGIFRESSLQHTRLPNDAEYRREFFEMEQPLFEEPSLFNTQPYDDIEIIDVEIYSEHQRIFCETFPNTTHSQDEPEIIGERTGHLDKDVPIYGKQLMCYVQGDEGKIKHGRKDFMDEEKLVFKSLCSSEPQVEKNSLMHDQDSCMHLVQKNLGQREKFKETDEHKCDAKEECASSQQQLLIQSEEAMRLRKRKEAETLRLLDVERRQKQRVEEVREMKKKDEDSINLKEHIRIEVRNALDELEMQYSDMASLLRSLGINVGGGFCPTPHEVHAAYKKALLTFHPDRASRTDLRQQVEAEEKFKLISRSKEKLLLVS